MRVSGVKTVRVRGAVRLQGRWRAAEEGKEASAGWVPWDKRAFKAVKKRVARWVQSELRRTLTSDYLLDEAFVGRRAHALESRSFAEVARAGVACGKLESEEGGGSEGRMAMDRGRVSVIAAARNGKLLGVHTVLMTYTGHGGGTQRGGAGGED